MDEALIRHLKVAVVGGAVALVLGTALLVVLLVRRAGEPAGEAPATTLALPADARIGQALSAGNQLVLLGDAADGRRFLAVVDLASGRRRHLLWIVAEPAAP